MRSGHSADTVSEFHAEAPQPTASEGLAQDPCVAARTGFEPTTLRSTGIDATNEPRRPITIWVNYISLCKSMRPRFRQHKQIFPTFLRTENFLQAQRSIRFQLNFINPTF